MRRIHKSSPAAGLTLAALSIFAIALPPAQAADEPPAAGFFSELDWMLRTGIGTNTATDSESAQAARTQLPDGAFGGIEALQVRGYLGENWQLKSDFRALPGLENYRALLRLDSFGGSYFDLNFRQFRQYDSTAGAYLPQSDSFYALADDDPLHVDRRFLTLEWGHTGFDWGSLYVRYKYFDREGQKNSSIWGLVYTDPPFDQGVKPSLLELDELRQLIEAGITVEMTEAATLEGRVFAEDTTLDNTYTIDHSEARRPSRVTRQDTQESEAVSGYASLRYKLHPQFTTHTSWSYSQLESSATGSHIYASDYYLPYDPSFSNYPHSSNASYQDLHSQSDWEQCTFQINGLYTPTKMLSIVPYLRFESIQQEADTSYTGLQRNFSSGYLGHTSDEFDRIEAELTLRLRPVNWFHCHARAFWAEEDGNIEEELEQDPIAANPALDYAADYRRETAQFTTGIDFKPYHRLVLRLASYYKEQDNHYGDIKRDIRTSDRFITGSGAYPGYIQRHLRKTWDANASITWRAHSRLSSVSRLDYQWMPLNATAFTSGSSSVESDTEHVILSQTLTWTPQPWFTGFLQGSYVRSRASSAADSNPSTLPAYPDGINDEVTEASNDYATLSLQATVQLSERAQLDCRYTYLKADNFYDNSEDSVPYDSSLNEHFVSARYTRQLKDGLIWRLGASAANSQQDSSGGHTDFSSFFLSSSLELNF